MVDRSESAARVWGDNTWVDQGTGEISEVLLPPPDLPPEPRVSPYVEPHLIPRQRAGSGGSVSERLWGRVRGNG